MRSQVGVGIALEAAVVGGVLTRPERIYDLPAGFSSKVLTGVLARRALEAVDRLMRKPGAPAGIDLGLVAAEARLDDRETSLLGDMVFQHGEPDVHRNAVALLELRRREGLRGSLQEALRALEGDASTEDVASRVAGDVLAMDSGEKPEVHEWRTSGLELLDAMEAETTGQSRALVTGFQDLDERLRIMPGNLVVLAARPAVGKSTLALNIASYVAREGGHVAFHSLEMGRMEVVARDIAAGGHITVDEVLSGSAVTRKAAALMREVSQRGDTSRLLINDTHYGLGAIQRISEKLHRKHGLKLIVVDYLQLVDAGLPRSQREAQVSAVSRGLKLLAQSTGVPVMALSQLNRETAKRGEQGGRGRGGRARRGEEEERSYQPLPRPRLHDLRESGAIEQDANVVLMLHHPYAESPIDVERTSGPYELLIAKSRMGRTGMVKLIAQHEHARFVPCVNSATA